MTKGIKLFKEILCGKFDNAEQISAELENGQIVHPFAQHVTGTITEQIKNVPNDFKGIFILEESYYDYIGKARIIKPLLFKITPNGEENVFLESIVIPEEYEKEKVILANDSLTFDYNELKINEAFGQASYNNKGDYFTIEHFCEFEGGIKFEFRETLRKNELQVMELYKKDGKQLTPYNTPIVYKRK